MVTRDIVERQNKILEIIVSSYVDTALPVGSGSVSKIVGLSSATVRNVMSDLEELGYIMHPHTSAGRIPTDKGYRCYVESLMQAEYINKKEAKRIGEEYNQKRKGIEDIIKNTAEVLSTITHHTGIILFPRFKRPSFKHIDLISIGKKKILVVLVTSTGIVKNLIIDTEKDLKNDLEAIVNLLNGDYHGFTLEDIKEHLIRQIGQQRDSSYSVLKRTSEIIGSMLELFYDDELYFDGTSYLLSQPEFENTSIAKLLLQCFEDKAMLLELMEKDLQEEGVRVYIGKENTSPYMKNCSIVTSGYKIKDELSGRLGIIGPTRMAYSHLIPLVGYISGTLTSTLEDFTE
ncbi:MAG: heat-inducible transcription repressor HrcA [Candidatus Omnitrophica bacterium]|nr:heat-inducible transcription repressor HrcA [Candidatus Omnitrophota bacterium]